MTRERDALLWGEGQLWQPGGPVSLTELTLVGKERAVLVLEDPGAFFELARGDTEAGGTLRVRGARLGTLEGRAMGAVAARDFEPVEGLTVAEHLVLAVRLARRVGSAPVPSFADVLRASGLEGRDGAVAVDLSPRARARLELAMALVRPAVARLLWVEDADVEPEVFDRVLRESIGGAVLVVGRRPVEVSGAVRFAVQGSRLTRATRPGRGSS